MEKTNIILLQIKLSSKNRKNEIKKLFFQKGNSIFLETDHFMWQLKLIPMGAKRQIPL